jgi:nitrite reductase/ring-hydroxylating ferredoxin subunit
MSSNATDRATRPSPCCGSAANADGSCDGCLSPDGRRQFLRDVAALVAAFGTLPLLVGTAMAANGDERTYPIPSVDGATIDRENEVIVVRYQGKVYAFALSCPHQNTALRWMPKDGRFFCTKHESQYRPDGQFITGRATRNMDRFDIRREGNTVTVNLAKWFQSDTEGSKWLAAEVAL